MLNNNYNNNKIFNYLNNLGLNNKIQSKYYLEIAKITIESNNPKYYFILPKINIKEDLKFEKSLLFILRFLNKYKMINTIETILCEYPKMIKFVNNNNNLDGLIFFDELMGISEDFSKIDFNYKVNELYDNLIN